MRANAQNYISNMNIGFSLKTVTTRTYLARISPLQRELGHHVFRLYEWHRFEKNKCTGVCCYILMANSLLGNVVCQGKTRYLFFSFRWRQKSTLLSRRILETFITGFILFRLKKISIKNISSSVLFARWFSMEKMWPFCKQSRARVCFPKELWANLIIETGLWCSSVI